jgi:branched-chain amino acid transport system substrate-binding protein
MPGKIGALAAAAAALSIALVGCGEESKPHPANASFDLAIGNLVPLRGDLADFGPSGRKAAELAEKQSRDAARKAGARVRVDIAMADSETQGLAPLISARKLISDSKASCLVGDWATASTLAVANQVAAKQGVPLISPASTGFGIADLDDRGYVFRTASPNQLQVAALANLVEQSIGGARGKRVSLAGRKDGYGTEFTRRFSAEWRDRGGAIAGPVLYDPTQASFAGEAKRIVAGDPDAFLIVDFPATYSRLATSLRGTGAFDPARLFLPDTLIVESASQWDIPGAALDGARVTRPGAPSHDAAGRAFERLFSGAPESPSKPAAFAAQAFDANLLCFLASIAAGSANTGALHDQIEAVSAPPGKKLDFTRLAEAVKLLRAGQQIDYEGASGPLDLADNGDPTSASYEVLTYESGAPQPSGRIGTGR